MVAHNSNLSPQEQRLGGGLCEASQGCIVRSYLKQQQRCCKHYAFKNLISKMHLN